MDLEYAKQMSRQGRLNLYQTHLKMLAGLDDAERAIIDQQAASMRVTFQASGIPINLTTARVAHMAAALPSVELTLHHPELIHGDNCIESHLIHVQLVAARFLQEQGGP